MDGERAAMNVLLVTRDVRVLREGSMEHAALKERAASVKRLVVVVLNTRRDWHRVEKVSESLWIFPTNGYLRTFNPILALLIAQREVYFQGRLQTDLISGDDALTAGFTAWLVAMRYRRPLHIHIESDVLSERYMWSGLINAIRALFARFVVQQAHALRAGSEAVRGAIAELSALLAERTIVTPLYLDVDSVQRDVTSVDLRAKYPTFKFILLCASPLVRSQNVPAALSVLAGILRIYPHAGLVIVGRGPRRWRLWLQARRLGLSERVAFEKKSDNLASYFKTAHVFIQTSPYEEHDNTIARAAAAGCAVVTTNVGSAPAIIEDNVSGFICESGDPACFVRNITSMIKHTDVRERIRLNGMLAVQRYMNTDKDQRMRQYIDSWQMALKESEE